ncbi:MAG TPA: serine hydrolase domain-containing protein [Candidatus Sulfopaludibacter sp.]|jgi:CubicO group peptidase (beta-lactamase class C family)|nr:serine hydrolase domain-containing protein [Candidatus Sulfopaludibacter sp.]
MTLPRVLLIAVTLLCSGFAADPAPSNIDAIFAAFNKPGSPGCALGVFRGGKIIYSKGFGLANVELDVPITPATVFDIGSTSKQFTAASILLLEKEGKLSLDDDIRKYLPELADYSGPGGGKVTILNLLNHTSGIRDYLTLFSMAGISFDGVTTDDTALALLARQKALNFVPGSDFLYSNSGYFLLSIIVKRVAGVNLRQYAQQHIFTPLDMTHTEFRDDHRELIPKRALAYSVTPSGFRLNVSYFEQLGDGGVHTTVEDLLKWDENFYTAAVGGKQFLAEIQERATLSNGKTLEYAKGLSHSKSRGLALVSHAGAWGGYRAELVRFPEQHFSIACLCNVGSANPSSLAKQVSDLYLKDLMQEAPAAPAAKPRPQPTPPTEPDAATLAGYAGDYSAEELGVTYRLSVAAGSLTLAAILEPSGFPRTTVPVTLRPTGKDKFNERGVNLQFERDSSGAVTGFQAEADRTRGIVFQRVRAGK